MYKALSFGLIAVTFFFATLPAHRVMQQEGADLNAEARHLLKEAAELATQIQSPYDRLMVFEHIAGASWRAGDKATAADSFDKALKIVATLPQENPYQDIREFDRARIAIVRAQLGDIDGAQQTLSLIKSDSEKSFALPFVASAQASAKNFADAMHSALAIQDSDVRDQAFTWIASQQADAGDTQGAAQLAHTIKNAQYRATALTHIAAVNANGGRTDEARNGMQEALAVAEQAEPREGEGGRSGLAACFSEEPEEPRDRALEDIAVNQAGTGDATGALETINRMHDKAGKENTLATVAGAQARAGDFTGARATIGLIGRDSCKTAALHGLVLAQFEAGNLSAALLTADEMTDVSQKAQTLAYLGHQVAKQGAINSAVAILARVREIARQIPNDVDRASILEQVAHNQAKMGSRDEAEKTLAEAVPFALASHESKNNGWNSSLQDLAVVQAEIGDLVGAWNTLALVNENERITVVQRAARARSEDGDIQGAQAWAARQASPRDKALALVGGAEGIVHRLESEKR
jgi:tetratricopeptide (TPR) repeat protein